MSLHISSTQDTRSPWLEYRNKCQCHGF